MFVPGVLACSAHVEKGDVVAVSVAVEQPAPEGRWGTGITRGTVMQGLQTGKKYMVIKQLIAVQTYYFHLNVSVTIMYSDF